MRARVLQSQYSMSSYGLPASLHAFSMETAFVTLPLEAIPPKYITGSDRYFPDDISFAISFSSGLNIQKISSSVESVEILFQSISFVLFVILGSLSINMVHVYFGNGEEVVKEHGNIYRLVVVFGDGHGDLVGQTFFNVRNGLTHGCLDV